MSDHRGFSLVEMVIVLVLAGLVSTAAMTMFTTQNRLNAQMTALGESQENARSAVLLAASELHAATADAVIEAEEDRLTLRLPIVVGIVCGEQNPQFKDIYFPMNGASLDDADIDGYAVREDDGTWDDRGRIPGGNLTRGGSGRRRCTENGGGLPGSDTDYATLRVGNGLGTPVMLYHEVSYFFAPSALDSSRRGFFRSADGQSIELAHGFTDDSRFEFQLGDSLWHSSLRTSEVGDVEAIRLLVDVHGEGGTGSSRASATFSLVREVQLRNVR